MSRLLRSQRLPSLSYESIHRCLPTTDCLLKAKKSLREKESEKKKSCPPSDPNSRSSSPCTTLLEHVTLKAVTSSHDSSLFNDTLHAYFIFPRPSKEDEAHQLVQLVCELVVLCADDSSSVDRWKFFLLVACHRRYHSKSPAFKERRTDNDHDSAGADHIEDSTAGDGERLVYYLTMLSLHRLWHYANTNANAKNEGDKNLVTNLRIAVESMIRVCFDIGGSRDLNAIVGHLTFETLLRLGHVTTDAQSNKNAPRKFGKKVLLPALKECLFVEDDNYISATSTTSVPDPFLMAAIAKISAMLDSDLDQVSSLSKSNSNIIKDANTPTADGTQTYDCLSTIHVTLPHNGRGSKKGASWQRCLVNCVAEFLIWSKTTSVATEDRFSTSLKKLCTLTMAGDIDMDTVALDSAHECILQMQTTIRKRRQLLNSEARERGYLLCSQYLLERSSLRFRQIRAGKAGDLSMLSRLAKKFRDARTLKMLLNRNTDLSRAQKAESIGDLLRDWQDVNHINIEKDSIEAIERQLQISMLKATVVALKPKNNIAAEGQRAVLVAQTGQADKTNAVCAILLASAIQSSTSCRLVLNGVEKDVSSEDLTLASIDEVMVASDYSSHSDCMDENVAVQNIILEDLADSQDAIIISNSDIQLTEDTLKHITEHDKTVRVHSPSRYDVKDSVEVKLKPNIAEKLRSKSHPIVLSVVLDCTASMGCEIEGCKEGAVQTIKTFSSLAPVSRVNILGYWDPIGMKGDPDPRSTGYLDMRLDSTHADIQEFVDTQLPCEGGGDIPEDVPAAIEKLIYDIEIANISSDDCVHFLFVIADAGYRRNEEERMSKLLLRLRDLDIVLIMCPVRQSRDNFVAQVKNVFEPTGQFIKVADVSNISSIAAIVTESVRASLFQTGTLASITSSIGDNFESLVQLSNFQKDLTILKNVKAMTKDIPCDDCSDVELDDEDDGHCLSKEYYDGGAAEVFVPSNTFGITNVDRMYLQTSKLPPVCHETVDTMYGGKTLQEYIAANVASRLLDESITIEQLSKSAYPPDIVELVRMTMGGHGRKRKEM